MKTKILTLGLVVVLCTMICLAGCSSKDEPQSQKSAGDILDHVDEGQVSGNEDMFSMCLESYGVPEDMLSDKAAELTELLFEHGGVTVVCGVTPRENSIIVKDDRDILWSVEITGEGKDLTFGKVIEASNDEYVAHGIRDAEELEEDCPDCEENIDEESVVEDGMPAGDVVLGDTENNYDE